MPKVSVIIPNYNHEPYLDQRINTVLNQTFQDFEVIILDDCSSDNSKDIIEQYKYHPKVSHIAYNEVNSGSTFKQWERGINISAGIYIWIAESDDWCEINFLETLIEGLENNNNCIVAYAQSYTVDEDDNIKWQSAHPKLIEVVKGNTFIKQYLLLGNAIFNASMAVFRKEAYYRISNKFSTFKFCGDWLFWTEMARQGDVFISGKLLNFFRKHSSDVSGTVYSTGYNFLEELRLIQFTKNELIITEQEYKKALLLKHSSFQSNKINYSKKEQKEIESMFYSSNNKSYALLLKTDFSKKWIKIKLKSFFKFTYGWHFRNNMLL